MIIEIAVLSLITIVACWKSIVSYLSQCFLPWLKEHCSPIIYEMCADLVAYVDRQIVASRLGIKKAYQWFKRCVVRSTNEMTLRPDGMLEGKEVTIVDIGEGKYQVHTATVVADQAMFAGVSADTLRRLHESADNHLKMDNKEAVLAAAQKQAQKDQIILSV